VRKLLFLISALLLATIPHSVVPTGVNAGLPRFVSVAASSYYDLGPVWWCAITEDGQWWTRDSNTWSYRGTIGPGTFVSVDGGSGTNFAQFIAITDVGVWWTNDGGVEWVNRGFISGTTSVPDPQSSSPSAQPATWGQVKARGGK